MIRGSNPGMEKFIFFQVVQSCIAAHVNSYVEDTGSFIEGTVAEAWRYVDRQPTCDVKVENEWSCAFIGRQTATVQKCYADGCVRLYQEASVGQNIWWTSWLILNVY